jgi:phage/plasmid-like protein (TIGR03299 family)
MAHEIDLSTGKAACFFADEPAWHGLGTVVSGAQTSEAAINLAGLNWKVAKQAVFYHKPGGELVPCPDSFAMVRQDTGASLGIVGNFYRPFQNVEAFDFMDSIVADGLAKFESAGALKGGRRVWLLARMPRTMQIKGDDVVDPYILLTTSHDGTSGVRILPTTVRVVCWNTLSIALRKAEAAGEGMSIVHTASLDDRIGQVRTMLGLVDQGMSEFNDVASRMANKQLSPEQLATYFAGLVAKRAEKQAKELLGEFHTNIHNSRNTISGIGRTVWAAYNAASEWADHGMRVTGKTTSEKLDNRLTSIWFGPSARFKAQAWQSALALVA